MIRALPARVAQRLKPPVGWLLFLLACVVVASPGLIADTSPLALHSGLITVSGLSGLVFGVLAGRTRRILARAAYLVLGIAFSAWLMLVIGDALPPLALPLRDAANLVRWWNAHRPPNGLAAPIPTPATWLFLTESLPRWRTSLIAAPQAGDAGARLMLATGGVLIACWSAIALGWPLAAGRTLFGWSPLPLAAMAVFVVLGRGIGEWLMIGTSALLLLVLMTAFRQRERGWERSRVDYSEMLRVDILVWGSMVIGAIALIAVVLPAPGSNPIAELLWPKVELPSGIAVMVAPPPAPRAVIALSSLPALEFGVSLQRPPAEATILTIHTGTPLPVAAAPRYWRARLLDRYDGRRWSSTARIGQAAPTLPADTNEPGLIVQDIADARADRGLLIGLANLVGTTREAGAEYLPDGTLTALTIAQPTGHYRVFSQPQEQATPPPIDRAAPDLADALILPADMPQRVGELARSIVGANRLPAAQAEALQSYLRALPYSYDVQPLQPSGGDAVDQFLFDMRQGYCTYYASAMAVMARTLGIPARVATGYATGNYDPSTGSYTVREADAHAWPELYIAGRWVAYEPTPIRPLPAATVPAPTAVGLPTPIVVSPDIDGTPFAWLLVATAAATLLIISAFWLARRRESPLARALRMLAQAGKGRGISWLPGVTVREYAQALGEHTPGHAATLNELVSLFEQGQYSGHPLSHEEGQRLEQAARRVQAADNELTS